MRYEIRELGIGEILDQAFKLIKDHFVLLMSITAVLLLPVMLVSGFLAQNYQAEVAAASTQNGRFASAAVSFPLPLIIVQLVTAFLLAPLTDAALTFAIAKCYLDKPTGLGESFRRALAIFIPLVLTWILTTIVVMFGFVLLIIPGIIFLFWYSLIGRVVVIEGLSGWAAMKRSKFLMKGNIGKAFALGFLTSIIAGLIGAGLNLVVPLPLLRIVLHAIVQVATTFFLAAVWVVFYFSCRCKAENFDLMVLADSVAMKDAPPSIAMDGNV